MSTGPTVEELVALRHFLTIVHHVPGRLRLRVGAALARGVGGGQVDAVKGWLRSLEGIREVEVRPLAASVTIHYDPKRLAAATWHTLLEGTEAEATAVVRAHMPVRH